jgi:CCR4-NOT transcription complex subunit 6
MDASLNTPSTMSSNLQANGLNNKPMGPIGPHYQKQLETAALSRTMTSQHHHTRLATTAARAAHSSSSNNNKNHNSSQSNPLMVIGDTPTQGNLEKIETSQWTALDLGGLGLSNVSRDLYCYSFLTNLYLNHNNLTSLSPDVAKLKNLTHLDVSGNKLSTLPPELGLVTSLTELWLFDNQLSFLPPEMGQLYQLEFLGIEGNMLGDPIESLIHKDGTQAAIAYLRDTCPGKIFFNFFLKIFFNFFLK